MQRLYADGQVGCNCSQLSSSCLLHYFQRRFEYQYLLETRKPINEYPSRDYQTCAFLRQFSPFKHDANESRYILTKTSKVNIFEVKFVLESIFKRFRKSAIRERFNLKRYTQMKKTDSNKRCNYFHQHSKNERKLYPFSLKYVITTFEHQVPEMYASQKSQVFFSLCRPETHFPLRQGHH